MRMDTCMATAGRAGTPSPCWGPAVAAMRYSTKRGGEALNSERLAASQKARVLVPSPLPGHIAQLVEYRPEKPKVPGSIPGMPTLHL